MEIISTLVVDVEAEGHFNLRKQDEQRRHVAKIKEDMWFPVDIMKDMCVCASAQQESRVVEELWEIN